MKSAATIYDILEFKGKSLIGIKFSRLLVTAFNRRVRNGQTSQVFWDCICDCGKHHVTSGDSLKQGLTRSCGCLHKEVVSTKGITHGLCRGDKYPQLYKGWLSMKRRCMYSKCPSFKNYGGRGIKVCRNLQTFIGYNNLLLPTWEIGLTLERIDNNGNYSCGQCQDCIENGWILNLKWATRLEQAQNRRTTIVLEIRGEKWGVKEWSRRGGISSPAIIARIARGWTPEEAVFTPPREIPERLL